MLKRYVIIASLLVAGGMVMAQSGYTGRVAVEQSVTKAGEDVRIHLEIGLDNLEMKSQHSLVLTPVLQSKDRGTEKDLAPVIINGRVRQKAYKRDASLNGGSRGCHNVVRRNNGKGQRVSYDVSLPYENGCAVLF